MQGYDAIQKRYGFDLPDPYRKLQRDGHFDSPPTDKYLWCHDCVWLPLQEIADFQFPSWEITGDGGFVPFAITGRHESYCWRLDWSAGGEPHVVLCERCERSICVAPNFPAFLYRMALEAFAGRNDFLGDAKIDELHLAVNIITPLLPDQWAQRLAGLDLGRWQTDQRRGTLYVIPEPECEAIIAADISFAHLNEKFIHDRDFLARMKRE